MLARLGTNNRCVLCASVSSKLASGAKRDKAPQSPSLLPIPQALVGERAVHTFETSGLIWAAGECPVRSIPVGWGTRIRTSTGRVRVCSPTIRRSPRILRRKAPLCLSPLGIADKGRGERGKRRRPPPPRAIQSRSVSGGNRLAISIRPQPPTSWGRKGSFRYAARRQATSPALRRGRKCACEFGLLRPPRTLPARLLRLALCYALLHFVLHFVLHFEIQKPQ